jgi:hypothetical protein
MGKEHDREGKESDSERSRAHHEAAQAHPPLKVLVVRREEANAHHWKDLRRCHVRHGVSARRRIPFVTGLVHPIWAMLACESRWLDVTTDVQRLRRR